MDAELPSQDVIDRLKSQHGDRALRLVELTNEDTALAYVMTGPSRAEYQKYQEEISSALDKKTDKEKADATRSATERAALAQIRWPDRPEAQARFEKFPAMVLKFVDILHDMAGDSLEVRSKKI